MSVEDGIRMRGEVVEVLPNAAFRIRLDNGHVVIGHVSAAMRMHYVRMLPGERVSVEVTRHDLSRARIVSRVR